MTESNDNRLCQSQQLKDAAWRLAEEWHARQRPSVEIADLKVLCPGFTKAQYGKAIHDALLWASK